MYIYLYLPKNTYHVYGTYDYPTGNSASNNISLLLQDITPNVYMYCRKITTTTTHKRRIYCTKG